jgi:hypothetical protein
MSVAEIAMVNATWLTLTVDEFKCKQTEEILSKRRDAEVAIQYVRKEKGCGVISKVPKVEIDGIEYYSCLCHPNFNDSSVHEYMWLYRQYKAGHLGYAGSLLDQPSKYIELIRFMDRLDAEHQNNQSEGQ